VENKIVVYQCLMRFIFTGNTWVRMLTEFVTGIYSGSTDASDKLLKEEFVGENFCSAKCSVIKAHPPQLALASVKSGTVEKGIVLTGELQKLKCDKHGMASFSRYIFLVRDPYKAIFAEVNREITSSHIGSASVDRFLESDWYRLVMNEAREYQKSWVNLISDLINQSPNTILFVKYEKLASPVERYDELFKIVNFIAPEDPPSLEKLHCAFIQSDVANVHRVATVHSMNASRLFTNMTLVDEVWEYVRDFALFAGYKKFVA
jgi:hypothetical protein